MLRGQQIRRIVASPDIQVAARPGRVDALEDLLGQDEDGLVGSGLRADRGAGDVGAIEVAAVQFDGDFELGGVDGAPRLAGVDGGGDGNVEVGGVEGGGADAGRVVDPDGGEVLEVRDGEDGVFVVVADAGAGIGAVQAGERDVDGGRGEGGAERGDDFKAGAVQVEGLIRICCRGPVDQLDRAASDRAFATAERASWGQS